MGNSQESTPSFSGKDFFKTTVQDLQRIINNVTKKDLKPIDVKKLLLNIKLSSDLIPTLAADVEVCNSVDKPALFLVKSNMEYFLKNLNHTGHSKTSSAPLNK